MAQPTITIIGLGKLGSSIGLALKQPELDFRVIGHDKDREAAKRARGMGAADSTSWNLIDACEPADLIIIAIPFDQVQGTLKAIGHELRPGCVVIDTSPLKQPVISWAAEYLDADVHFVSISLGRNPEAVLDATGGPEGARADLFTNSPCCLMPDPRCQPEAVKTAQDLARLLGATPYFMDPEEYDGVSTVVNLMPALLAAALLGPASASAGWREMRRLASDNLMRFSSPLAADGPALAESAVLTKANVLRWLDAAVAELQTFRAQVDQDDLESLTAELGAIYEAREQWLVDWKLNRWEGGSQVEMPTIGSFFGQLIGFGSRRKPGDQR